MYMEICEHVYGNLSAQTAQCSAETVPSFYTLGINYDIVHWLYLFALTMDS